MNVEFFFTFKYFKVPLKNYMFTSLIECFFQYVCYTTGLEIRQHSCGSTVNSKYIVTEFHFNPSLKPITTFLGTSMVIVKLSVGNTSAISNHTLCAQDIILRENKTFYCRTDVIGRYVSITMREDKYRSMRMCEVEVWGYTYKGSYNSI